MSAPAVLLIVLVLALIAGAAWMVSAARSRESGGGASIGVRGVGRGAP